MVNVFVVDSGVVHSGGNLRPAMGARNQVGIGLLYRPASLCSLATQFQTRFLESIPQMGSSAPPPAKSQAADGHTVSGKTLWGIAVGLFCTVCTSKHLNLCVGTKMFVQVIIAISGS
jgi:hypothetical protein